MSYAIVAVICFFLGALAEHLWRGRLLAEKERQAVKLEDSVVSLAARLVAANREVARLHNQLTDARDVNDRLVRRLSGRPSDLPEAS